MVSAPGDYGLTQVQSELPRGRASSDTTLGAVNPESWLSHTFHCSCP